MLLVCVAVASYGENFRRLRGDVSQEEIARRLKLKRQANISAIELGNKIPSLRLILKHAAALKHPPSELLKDVSTDYDRIRAGEYDGRAFAIPLGSDGETDPISGAPHPPNRRAIASIERITRDAEQAENMDQPASAARIAGKHAATAHAQAAGRSPRVGKHRR